MCESNSSRMEILQWFFCADFCSPSMGISNIACVRIELKSLPKKIFSDTPHWHQWLTTQMRSMLEMGETTSFTLEVWFLTAEASTELYFYEVCRRCNRHFLQQIETWRGNSLKKIIWCLTFLVLPNSLLIIFLFLKGWCVVLIFFMFNSLEKNTMVQQNGTQPFWLTSYLSSLPFKAKPSPGRPPNRRKAFNSLGSTLATMSSVGLRAR